MHETTRCHGSRLRFLDLRGCGWRRLPLSPRDTLDIRVTSVSLFPDFLSLVSFIDVPMNAWKLLLILLLRRGREKEEIGGGGGEGGKEMEVN